MSEHRSDTLPEAAMRIYLAVFTQRKMAGLLLLGFSGGLPLLLTSKTLQAWMTVEGVDLTTIGLVSLAGLPYSLKFLWSPVMDRYTPPLLGRRRGWIALAQVVLAASIAALALGSPKSALLPFATMALAVALLSASQDIAIDAYRADVLETREMGAGVAAYILGYRLAMIVAGSLTLILAEHLSWRAVYLLMALLMLLAVGATAWAPEPVLAPRPPQSLAEAVVDPFRDFFGRSGWKAIALLGFIVLYRYGDSLAANMATPFLLKIGFTKTDVGAIQGGVGVLATILGVMAGGGALASTGINRALWLFGGLQVISNLGYYLLSLKPGYGGMVACIIFENFCAGLGTAAFVAFMMSLCSARYTATQYALLTSLMAFSRDILVSPAGRLAESAGWPAFFLITLAAGVPGLLLLPVFAPWGAADPKGAREAAMAAL